MRNSELNSIAHLLIATAGGEWASAFFSFEQSYVATGSLNRALGAGAIVIASAMAHEYVGSTFALSTTDGRISNAIGNAFVGGITADLQGGKFGHGFASAGFSAALKFYINDIGGNQSANSAIANRDLVMLKTYKAARVFAAAAVGGTASVISGGKFANGAMSGAFAQLYNGEKSSESEIKWVRATPEHSKIMKKLRKIAQSAADDYDAACDTTFCALPWIRGTGIHKRFAAKVRLLGADYDAEVSYKDRRLAGYGEKGSVRADAIYGSRFEPELIFELKTGFFSYVSQGEAEKYFDNIPNDNDPALVLIKVR